jgi:serine/threonine protein kinase
LAKDLLIRMLDKEQAIRITAENLLNHEWFQLSSSSNKSD